MWAGEKVVVVTVCKIFNWEATREQLHFHLSFHSIKTQTLLMEKKISGKAASNEVQFNYSLRISYAPDENEILIKLSQESARGSILLTEIPLNLDYLSKKKVQFFPFGKNDKVLKILAGPAPTPALPPRTSENESFIREKEGYIRKVASNSLSRQSSSNSLSQIRNKGQMPTLHRQPMADYYDGHEGYKEIPQLKGKIKSYQHLPSRLLPSRAESRGDSDWEKQSNRSQKHRLRLKDLDLQPVQNQYYEQFSKQRKLERKSDIITQHYHSQQKLIRSQFY